MCLGVKRHLASGHEISRLQHDLQLIMARYTRIINCRPCCNLYVIANHILLRLWCCRLDNRNGIHPVILQKSHASAISKINNIDSTATALTVRPGLSVFITFRVSRRRREMYCGHPRMCVCLWLSAAACLHYSMDPDVAGGMVGDARWLCTIGRICNRCTGCVATAT